MGFFDFSKRSHGEPSNPAEVGDDRLQSQAEDIPVATDADLEAFWTRAVTRAKLNPLEVVMGSDDTSVFRPPSFAFGDTPQMADELASLVVSGQKTATTSLARAYGEDEQLPQVGEMDIVTDGSGLPRALIVTEKVEVVPFLDIDSDVARDEGSSPRVF